MPDFTDKRKEIIERFRSICLEDDRVVASFIGGSFATGSADEFSDLDLYAIVASEAYEQFLAAHREFFKRFSEPVLLEHFDGFGFDMYVFVLAEGIQGELALAKPDHFDHIHGGPYEVLVDKAGLLEDVEFPWQRPTESQQLDQLRTHLNWFWRDLSLLSVAMGREQHWTAVGYLQSMRLRCIHLLRLDKEFGSWSNGYEKLELAVDERELQQLEDTFPRVDPQEILSCVGKMVSSYRRLAPRLAREHGVDYPHHAEQVVIEALARATGYEIGPTKDGSG